MILNWELDTPGFGDRQTPYDLHCSGWLHLEEDDGRIDSMVLLSGTHPIGETRTFFHRPDVAARLGIDLKTPTGFRLCGNGSHVVKPARFPRKMSIAYRVHGEDEYRRLGSFTVRVVDRPDGARNDPYGKLLDRQHADQLSRDDIYGSGPPDVLASPSCSQLILGLLEPGASVLDLGCGAGPYGKILMDAGHDWRGIDFNPAAAALAHQSGISVEVADATATEFDDDAFDHVLLIEVIEHIDEPSRILEEARRLARRSVIISVPNVAAIPLLFPYGVVPWHLLEADHKNFFSPGNLATLLGDYFEHVDVVPYGELSFRTLEGARITNHLLAICS
jgi:2-polyprenyl-3-methyl-5-hydroxy-6-metoxy-1,4-benzoquinol methylase